MSLHDVLIRVWVKLPTGQIFVLSPFTLVVKFWVCLQELRHDFHADYKYPYAPFCLPHFSYFLLEVKKSRFYIHIYITHRHASSMH